MATVALPELMNSLPEVVARVERGEEVLIARDGKPVVRMTPIEAGQPSVPRRPLLGALKGRIRIADDFDAPMTDEELREWYDRPIQPGT